MGLSNINTLYIISNFWNTFMKNVKIKFDFFYEIKLTILKNQNQFTIQVFELFFI